MAMNPIVLIHGYSAESKQTTPAAIAGIYGDLPQRLRTQYPGEPIIEINLSRYISLDDGVTIEDVADALDRILKSDDFKHLLDGPFNVVIHSTGALVIRAWLRRFRPEKPSLDRIVYLAGANLGSGWAHIGRGQMAKWARKVFQGGAERGLEVLSALELGSSSTLDLHLFFRGDRDLQGHGVREAVMIGTQADVAWYEMPIAYAKEDGSDGVIRASATNLNYNYVRYVATKEARALDWDAIVEQEKHHLNRKGDRLNLYEVADESRPGKDRTVIPFAVVDQCAHSGKDMGIVSGSLPRDQVMRLIDIALTAKDWPAVVERFDEETKATYEAARNRKTPAFWKTWLDNGQSQYDRHAQVVFRLRDQFGRPVTHYDVFFDSVEGKIKTKSLPMRELINDKHINGSDHNIIVFYLRVDKWDENTRDWASQIPATGGCYVEVTAVQPDTGEVKFLPFRMNFTVDQLMAWVQPHRTTIIDIEMYRIGSPDIYRLTRLP
jgi:pimeloyl-ACP methyl ester carboxylesterase